MSGIERCLGSENVLEAGMCGKDRNHGTLEAKDL